jgi:acetolactate synthase I/II/III large subunit
MKRTAALLLLDTLERHGVDRIFCVPGETFLSVLDAAFERPVPGIITCRHEGAAGYMALADAKVTGRTGVVMVSRGPGATNAAIALHSAQHDAAPLLLIVGQVASSRLGRPAYEEMDYRKLFSGTAKAVEEVQDPRRISEVTARLLRLAETGTPGPVVLSVCSDTLALETDAPLVGPSPPVHAAASANDLAAVAGLLSQAERPVLIAGGLVRTPRARAALRMCAEAWALPVLLTFENQDLLDNRHPSYAGLLGVRPPGAVLRTARSSDLVLAVGTRLGDMTTQGFSLPDASARLIHVYPDANQMAINFRTSFSLVSEPASFLEGLASHHPPSFAPTRRSWLDSAHAAFQECAGINLRPATDGIDFGHVIRGLEQLVSDDVIIATDSGSFAGWFHRHFHCKSTQLLLGTQSGAMGFGLPAAVAAALRFPGRRVVALLGDGGAMMTGFELATAMKERLSLCVIVANNGSYGSIRFHQENRFPGRTLATGLVNPDFALLARAFGARGLTVAVPEDVAPVLEEALGCAGPVVVDVRTSLENVTPATTLGALRASSQKQSFYD